MRNNINCLPTHVDWSYLVREMGYAFGNRAELEKHMGFSRKKLDPYANSLQTPLWDTGLVILSHALDVVSIDIIRGSMSLYTIPYFPIEANLAGLVNELVETTKKKSFNEVAEFVDLKAGTIGNYSRGTNPAYGMGVIAYNAAMRVLPQEIINKHVTWFTDDIDWSVAA